MKDWSQLTESGQVRRLRPLAEKALEQYPIRPDRIRLVGGFSNVIFRVDTAHGPYALRVDLHQGHSDTDVENELSWLEALSADTDLDVCRFLTTRNGERYVRAEAPGVPGVRRCVLFEWIPGNILGANPTETGYHQLGQLAAGLHLHGAAFTPPHPPLTWDRVFYWPEDIDPVVINEPWMDRYLDAGRRSVLRRVMPVLDAAFARLDPSHAQMIHGDLHPDNVHRFRKRLIAFDFEDVTWGHPVQDVAVTLFYQRDHPGYRDLRAAFEEGYRSIAAWPVTYEGELEHFMAARSVMFINYVANLRGDPSEYYRVVFPRLERFLGKWAR